MAQRRKGFIVVLLLLVYSGGFGQLPGPSAGLPVVQERSFLQRYFAPKSYSMADLRIRESICYSSRPDLDLFSLPAPVSFRLLSVIPADFYARKMGYICRQELSVQKKLNLPLVLRLGSPDYVNWMEQKPNARRFD